MSISEQNFKIVVNALWKTFAKSITIVKALESIGLNVALPVYLHGSELNQLYDIQDVTATTMLQLIGIKSELPGSNERQTILEELNQFLMDTYTTHPDSNEFPKSCYSKLLDIFTVSGQIKLPWNNEDTKHDV